MADHHGEVEYATADGNDYAEHEATYENFVHLTIIGVMHVINIVLGLAIGGVAGYWFRMTVFIVVATIVAAHGLSRRTYTPSAVMVVLGFLLLAASTIH